MSLLRLPTELILLIGDELSLHDLTSLIRTNRTSATRFLPILYSTAAKYSHFDPLRDLNGPPGTSGLHLAARRASPDVVKQLLLHNAWEIAYHPSSLETPLHVAAQYGREDIVSIILEFDDFSIDPWKLAKHDPTIRQHGVAMTPLHVAAREGHVSVIRRLLRDAPEHVNDHVGARWLQLVGDTALHFAVQSAHLRAVQTLIELGADVCVQGAHRRTPLHIATLSRWKPEVLFTINEKERAAADAAKAAIAKVLVAHGADVNVKCDTGDTPLHWACARDGSLGVAKVLLEAGCDFMAVNRAHCTPLDLAAEDGLEGIVELLLNYFGLSEAAALRVIEEKLLPSCMWRIRGMIRERIATLRVEKGVGEGR